MITRFQQDGILIDGSSNDVITRNYIGTNTGGANLGNANAGIDLRNAAAMNLIGGTVAGNGNVIAFSGWAGVTLEPTAASGNQIVGNSIYSNTGLGIDLNNDGVTPNDVGDPDSGPNDLKNFPVLTSAQVVSPTQVAISGTYNSIANTTFRIEFFSNATGDPTGYGEGQTYLGFTNITTDGSGNATFSTVLNAAVAVGGVISATSTDQSNFDTSEFAQNVVVPANTAPTLDASKSPVLTAELEDLGAPAGAVGTLVSSLVDFAVPAGQVDNVTDPNLGALLGIAVTAANTTNGTWFYSTNNGTTWNALGAVANNNALLLAADASTRLYFQPNANWNGTVPNAITFRAWDQTSGSNGTKVSTNANGGTTAFSTATDTASIAVAAVNDAPVVDLNAAGAGQDVTTAFTEQTPVLIAPVGTLTDVDSANLSSLTVTLTARPDGNAVESLSLNAAATAAASGAGLTVSYTAGTGVLSITGSATTAVYQSILQGVLYNDTSDTPTTSNRSITVVTNDGAINSATQTVTLTVAAVNDAPVVDLNAAGAGQDVTTAFTEQTPVLIAPVGTLTDVDSANLSSLTVTLTARPDGNAVESLSLNAAATAAASGAGLTVSYTAGTGVLSITGSATTAVYQSILQGVLYNDTSDTPTTSNRSITVVTNDGAINSATQTVTLTVAAVNDAPVVDLNAAGAGQDVTTAFTEQTPVLIAPVGTLTDVDSANLSSLTVTLTARPDGNAVESLSLNAAATAAASGAGLTVSYTAGTGVLSITGSATTAVYQSILQGVLYNDTSDTPTTSNRSITVVTNDGAINSATQTVTLTVAAVNDAPVVDLNAAGAGQDVTTAFTEQTPVLIAPVGTLTDVDSANLSSLTVTLTARPDGNAVESLSLNAAATAAASGAGLTVSYTAGTGVLSITGSATTAVYQSILQGVLYNDTSDTPTTSNRSITVVTNDGAINSATQTVTLTVAAVNDAPVVDLNAAGAGQDVTTAFTEQTPVLIAPVGTLTDVDSANLSSLTVTLTARPDGNAVESLSLNAAATAAASGAGLTVSYTAGTGVLSITGSATTAVYQSILQGVLYNDTSDTPTTSNRSITVVTNDGAINSATQTVTLTVAAVNDAPVNTVPGPQTVAEDTALAIGGVSVTDVDGNLSTVQLGVANGTVTVSLVGGATISAGANGTGTLTLAGTAAQINAALGTLAYQGNLNFNGSDVLTVTSSDGTLTDVDTVALTVTPVNDAPVNTVPGPQTVAEDTALAIGGVSVTDVDGNLSTVQLGVANGTVTVSLVGGATISAGANGTGTLTLAGTAAQINAALGTLAYQGNLNFNGSDVLTVTSSDGTLTDVDTVALTVTPVNDAPVNTVPGPQTVAEDTALAIGGVSVTDVDGNLSTVQLGVANGTVTVSLVGGATISAGANGTGTLTLAGTAAQINAALGTLAYQGNLNFNGSDVLTVTSSDGTLTDVDTVALTVTPVNDAPVNTVPGPQTVAEDTALAIGGVSVTDVDGNLSTVQLGVANGTVTVSLVGGATISAGANGTGTLTLAGTAAQINAALGTLAYQGNLNFNGSDVLTVTSSDGTLTDVDTVALTVTPVNDAPVNTVPGPQTVAEDTALAIGGVSVTDVDGNLSTVQLGVANGTVTVSLVGGATISAGANGTGTLTLAGTAAQINAALGTLAYQGNLNFNGSDVLTVTSSDGTLTDVDTVALTVTPVNDAPVNTVPGPQTVAEDTALAIGGVSVTDVDGNLSTVQLGVANGTVTVSLVGGATISAGANGTGTLTLAGTAAQINAALGTLAYQGNLNFNGSDVLTVTSSDGTLTDVDTVALTVTPVNDAPVNTVPGPQTVAEDTALAIGGVSVTDVDGNLSTVQLGVANGTVTVSLVGGATISAGANGTGTLTLAGTAAQINAALGTLAYQGNLNFNGSDVLTVTSSDGTLTDVDTVALTVTPVNDAPVNTVPGPQTVAEDTALAIGGVSVTDVDGNLSTVQLGVANGTVTVSLVGGATISAGANGTGTLTLAGTAAQINAALGTLAYQGNLNFNGSDVLTVTSSDGTLTDVDTVALTVTPVNDAPVNTVPGPQTVAEDTALAIGGVSVTDVDGNLSTVQLGVANGTVTVSLVGGATISAGANGTGTLTLAGTAAQINAALGTLAYQGNLNFNGSDVLTVTSSDGTLTDVDTVALTVTPVNDAPVNTVPGPQTVAEDTALAIGGVSVTDVDGNLSTVQLGVANGTVTVSLVGGATISAGANGTGTLTLAGTAAQINAALGTLAYQGNLNFNGSDVLTVTSSDGTLTDVDTVALTVTPVNDAPVNTVPGPQTVAEDTALAIGGVSVTDVDGNLSTVQLGVANGTVTVSLVGGATISAGANGTGTLTLAGTAAQINAALGTLAYQGNLNFNGSDVLTVTSSDGTLTDVDTVALTVTPVNDAPVNTVPGPQTVAEDTALAIGGVSVTDVDGNLSTVQLGVANGTVTVSLVGGATISAGANGTGTLTLAGTAAQINAALGTLAYQGNLNFNGSDVLTVTSSDGTLTDVDTVALTVTPVNDAPVNTVPGPQTVAEDTALAIGGVSVTDVDGNLSTVQLGVANGTVTVSLVGGATISAGANGTGTLTLAGTAAQINAALGTLAYQGNLNFNGSDVLTVTSSDGTLTDVDTVALTVTPVNDAPVNTVPGPQTVAEDTALAIGGVSVTDVDGNLSTVQLGVANGTVTVSLVGGATISAGANGTGTLTLAGTAAQINAALGTLAYQGNLNFNGSDVLTVTSSDGTLTDVDTVALTVTPVNDAPVNTVPGPQTVAEDTALAIGGVSVTDVDGNLSTVQLGVANGTVTVSLVGGATISAGANGTGTLTLAGTAAQINAALGTLAYQGNLNFNGSDVLTVTSSDGTLTDVDTVALTVTPVNDAPVNTVPGPQTVAEDTALAIGGVSVTDVDGNLSTVQLGVANGTVTVSLVGGATISAGANGTGTLTLAGTAAQINAALGTLAYQGNLNFNGSDVLTVTSSDGTLTDVDTVALTVTPAPNIVPSLATNAGSTVVQGLTDLITLGELQVTDADNTPAQLIYTVTVGPVHGQLELTTAPGVVIVSFTQADIDAGRLVYVNNGANSTSDSFTFTVSDGAGGMIGATAFNITVTPFFPPPLPSPPLPPLPPPDPVPVPITVIGPPGPIPGDVVPPVLPPPVLATTVGAIDDPVRRAAMPSQTFARVEQPDIVLEEPPALELEPLSNPVKTMLAAGHKFAENLTGLADNLERAIEERENQARLIGRVASFAGMALSVGFVAWILRGGALVTSFLVSMPAWRHFDPLPVLGSTSRDRRKRDRKVREEHEQENKEFRGLDRVLKSSPKSAKQQETDRARRPKS